MTADKFAPCAPSKNHLEGFRLVQIHNDDFLGEVADWNQEAHLARSLSHCDEHPELTKDAYRSFKRDGFSP